MGSQGNSKHTSKELLIIFFKTIRENNSTNNKLNKTTERQTFKVVRFVANYWMETRPHTGPFSSLDPISMQDLSQTVCWSPLKIYRIIFSLSSWFLPKIKVGGRLIGEELVFALLLLVLTGPAAIKLETFIVTLSTLNCFYWLEVSAVQRYSSSQLLLVIYLYFSFITRVENFAIFFIS